MNTVHPNCINEVISCGANVLTPEVGMLGTYFVGSDRYAVLVTDVISPKKIIAINIHDDKILENKKINNGVEYLSDELTNMLMENALPKVMVYKGYEDETDDIFNHELERFLKNNTYTLRKNGRWVESGRDLWSAGAIHLGVADPYLDPSF